MCWLNAYVPACRSLTFCVVALNHFFDLESIYQVASNEQDAAFFNQKKLNKELTAAQRVMGS